MLLGVAISVPCACCGPHTGVLIAEPARRCSYLARLDPLEMAVNALTDSLNVHRTRAAIRPFHRERESRRSRLLKREMRDACVVA